MSRIIPDNEHREFNNAPTWVALFEFTINNTTYYYTPNIEEVTCEGNTYEPFPILLEDIDTNSNGDINNIKLTISNIEGVISTALKTSGSIDGEFIVFKVFSTESENIIYEETFEIISCGPVTSSSITFEIGIFNPWTVKLLQEKYLSDFCWNIYKGKGCYLKRSTGTYSKPSGFIIGDTDTCNKRREDCQAHNNTLRRNSFPGLPNSSWTGGGGTV